MNHLKSQRGRAFALAAVLTVAAAPAFAQERSGRGDDLSQGDYQLSGAGVSMLLPELRHSAEGRAFVMRYFDRNDDGQVSPGEAQEANRGFLRNPDERGNRVEPVSRDTGPTVAEHRASARAGMRAYRMRQTERGATFNLQDVLFETGSAQLLPTAVKRLEPLASYLRANPNVPVRIEGHTDSVGNDTDNQILSERRADAVSAALSAMGVAAERYVVAGYGETMPVASNADEAGRELNRRVEVTLVGQQARSFSE